MVFTQLRFVMWERRRIRYTGRPEAYCIYDEITPLGWDNTDCDIGLGVGNPVSVAPRTRSTVST